MASAEKAQRHYRSGLAAYREGRRDEAVRSLRRAVDLAPANADWRYDLAVMLQEGRRHAAAAAEYRRVVRMRGEAVDALSNLALCLRALGEFEEAERCARRAVELAPGSGQALHNLGVVQRARGDAVAAIATLRRAADLQPDSSAVWRDLGDAYLAASDYASAEECFGRAIQINPAFGQARADLGYVLAARGRLQAAEELLRGVIAGDANNLAAFEALATTLLLAERSDEALVAVERGLAVAPDSNLSITRGWIHHAQGHFDAAIEAFQEALRLDPDASVARFNLGFILLTLGQFGEGWRAFQSRPHKRPLPENGRLAELETTELAQLGGRRILLVGDWGLGDELFFLRFAPALQALGARLAYWGDPRLRTMLERTGLFEVVSGYEDEAPVADLVARVGDLPAILGDREGLPRPPPLRLEPMRQRVERLRAVLAASGPPPYLGLTWQAGLPTDRFDALRKRLLFKHVDPAALAAVVTESGATPVIVQRAPTPDERAAFAPGALDLSAVNDDLEDMLALMTLLDDYVGVSNTNMHLRAGLGLTARVLVPLPPEWRWQADAAESPWFPGFAIYRQTYPVGWGEALARLRQDLAATVPV